MRNRSTRIIARGAILAATAIPLMHLLRSFALRHTPYTQPQLQMYCLRPNPVEYDAIASEYSCSRHRTPGLAMVQDPWVEQSEVEDHYEGGLTADVKDGDGAVPSGNIVGPLSGITFGRPGQHPVSGAPFYSLDCSDPTV